jgi:hypothetical protein
MARKANPVANAPRARVPTRAGHGSFGLRCGKWSSRWGREVQANLSAIEGVADVSSRGSRDTLLCALQNKDEYTKPPRNNTPQTNLGKIDELPTSKIWASSDGTGGQPTRGFIGLGEQTAFGGKRRICRLVLLLLQRWLVERRRINPKRASPWSRRRLVVCFYCGRGNVLVALSRDTLQERNRCVIRVTVGAAARLVDIRWGNTIRTRSCAVCWQLGMYETATFSVRTGTRYPKGLKMGTIITLKSRYEVA